MASGDANKSNRPTHNYAALKIDDIEERLNNTITIGTVVSVDKEAMTARVSCLAGEVTVKAFVLAQGSADYSQWIPPVAGDKVLLLSDNGDFNESYALPVRLPESYTSNIPDGMEIQAGNFSFQYNKDDNSYLIVNGDRELLIDSNKVELSNSSTNVTVNASNVEVSSALGSVNVGPASINVNVGPSNISLTPASCTIAVPGGVLVISSGSLSFNGQQVVRV